MKNNFILKVLVGTLILIISIISSSTAKDNLMYPTTADRFQLDYNWKSDHFNKTIDLLRRLADQCTPYALMTSSDIIVQFEQADLVEICYRKALQNLKREDDDLVKTWFGGKTIKKDKLSNTVYRVIDDLGYTVKRKKVHDLLMETAAIESAMGEVVKQKGGPARGVFQIIPSTDRYVNKELKKKDPVAYKKIMKYYDSNQSEDWNRKYNVQYNAAVSLSYYYMVTNYKLDDMISTRAVRASLYKKKYNTNTHAYLIPRYMQRASQYLD